ncbi:Zinc finger protein NUTCRACKER [Platanthera guangdongensis]|uniref:Zinc finger protein NUTCRACKER n=1 Tax=Platanthera guangdongensis TaxID=2320717 RepID=A0ABR2MQV3_9ASPA
MFSPEEAAHPFTGNITTPKKKRRPAGTPDPAAEVVSLSPCTLLESERYVCEICSQCFQRDQNLQMHRRRHKVPWKLLKREPSSSSPATESRKRVFVCPEPSCLHHSPCHALGDLVGIKKHYRRKHSVNRQWACARCRRSYAVHSDYKAHLKTCGTRGHSCDCGRVFSRVETFIEHQDSCSNSRTQPPPSSLLSTSGPVPCHYIIPGAPPPPATSRPARQYIKIAVPRPPSSDDNIELQPLLPPPSHHNPRVPGDFADLNLSIALPPSPAKEAARQVQLAERELVAAQRIRQQAHAELKKACTLREVADQQINSSLLQITCNNCRQGILTKHVLLDGGHSFGSDDKSLRLED